MNYYIDDMLTRSLLRGKSRTIIRIENVTSPNKMIEFETFLGIVIVYCVAYKRDSVGKKAPENQNVTPATSWCYASIDFGRHQIMADTDI